MGLKVTGKQFFGPQVTVHYPREGVDNLDTFRGPIELKASPNDPTRPLCIACMTCVSTCPSQCITVVKKGLAKPEPHETNKTDEHTDQTAEKKADKGPSEFKYDYTRCSLCGLCVENCPKGALGFSDRVLLAGPSKEAFVFDLLEMISRKTLRRRVFYRKNQTYLVREDL
ncbi:MAG: 4Fe-4S binding protein [Deltaproteobacteria bacterium]|nr:4Fe-4S binding protein [Deltaproteobacteria bacterium]